MISLYFSKLPYLFGVLSYIEIEKLLKEELTLEELIKDYKELLDSHLNILVNKLKEEKASILEETIHLKFLQIFVIKFLKRIIKLIYKFEFEEYSQYPIMIRNLMDIDFCLKLFFFRVYGGFDCIGYKTKCRGALDEIDKRILVFNCIYLSKHFNEEYALKHISKEELNLLNENLKIVDFIIIGNENFHNIIKGIENYFPHKKNMPYLQISEVRNFLIKQKENKYRNFTYFIIISAEEAEIIYKELYKIEADFALMLFLIIYLKDSKTLINKEPFLNKAFMPFYIAYDTNDIINFINSQDNLSCAFNFFEQSSIIINILNKIKIPNVWNENEETLVDKLNSEEGWELVDCVPEEIFKIKIIGSI